MPDYRVNGYPAVVSGQTNDMDSALAAVRQNPSMISAASVVTLALKRFTNPAFALVDATGGRVIVTDSGTMRAQLLAALGGYLTNIVLKPDNGQSGVALTWRKHSENSWPYYDYTNPLFTPAKARYSAPAMMQSVMGKILTGFALIDQANPSVTFLLTADDVAASAAVKAVAPPSNGKSMAVDLYDVEQATFV